jgi:hypothetical protein
MAEGRLERTRRAYEDKPAPWYAPTWCGHRECGTLRCAHVERWNVIEGDFDTACDHGDENDTPWAI